LNYSSLHSSRYLHWPACYNARDVGGYPTADGQQTRWRVLVRADNMSRLTPAGQTALSAYGVRTIIDLRFAEERDFDPNPFATQTAVQYLNLSLLDEADEKLAQEMASITSLEEWYRYSLDRSPARIGRIVTAIAEAPDGGVLVHCHAGKDRTGLIVALVLAAVGVPYSVIVEDYALSAVYLKPHWAELIKNEPDPQRREQIAEMYQSPPDILLTALAHLDKRHRGPRAYLLTAGVTEQQLMRLRERLVEH
jgi:protein-tyrosine phosphatase